eukprot:16130779-Heterocapsa_arctica.AAC.1
MEVTCSPPPGLPPPQPLSIARSSACLPSQASQPHGPVGNAMPLRAPQLPACPASDTTAELE